MQLTFRGRTFVVTYEDLGENNGECCDSREFIMIHKRMKGFLRLDTEIHEALHACFPMIEENPISISATDIARFLWKLGYRLKE